MTLTSGTVIDRISRVGDIGEPGYSAYGQTLRKCTYSGSKDDWHGATQDTLSSLLPTCYITESVYSYLTKAEIESVKSRIKGIVPNSYAEKVYGGIDSFMKSYYCWQFLDGIEARPLTHVPSHPFCVSGTFYQVHKFPGADEYVVTGAAENYPYCDGDTLLPMDDIPPGDEPDTGEPDDDIPNGDDDIPHGDEYPPKSELAIDLSSIFGDIKPIYIIAAIIALILLG